MVEWATGTWADNFFGLKSYEINGSSAEFTGEFGLPLRLKHQVQHPAPVGHRMLRWTNGTSTSTARNVA